MHATSTMNDGHEALNQSVVMVAPASSDYRSTTSKSIGKKSYLQEVPEEERYGKLFEIYKSSLSPSRKIKMDKTLDKRNQQSKTMALPSPEPAQKQRPKSGHGHSMNYQKL